MFTLVKCIAVYAVNLLNKKFHDLIVMVKSGLQILISSSTSIKRKDIYFTTKLKTHKRISGMHNLLLREHIDS